MKRIVLGIILLLLVNFLGLSQIGVGEWRDHFSLKDVDCIVKSKNLVYGSSKNGLIIYDLTDNSYKKMTKANGLSDVGISALGADDLDNVIVGYSNGNIDIISSKGIYNMRDLISKSMQDSKKINSITTYGGKAYLSCDFGILVLNLSKLEVSDTYFLSSNSTVNPVYKVIIQNNILFAATGYGIFSSLLSSPTIQIFSSWNQFSKDLSSYANIEAFSDEIVVARGKKDGNCSIESYKDNLVTFWLTCPTFRDFSVGQNFYVIDKSFISVWDKSHSAVTTVSSNSSSFLTAKIMDNLFFVGKFNFGMLFYNDFLKNDSVYQEILPNGPASNSNFDLNSSSYGVWLTPGGLTGTWNNKGLEPYYSFFDGIVWKSFTSNSIHFSDFSSEWDLLKIAINPNVPSEITFCSWGSGIFRVMKNDSVEHYDQHNSALRNIFSDERNYVRVGGIAIDKEGNTWMNNAGSSDGGIVVRTLDNTWYVYDYENLKSRHSQGQILIAKNGFKWSFIPDNYANSVPGIIVWDDNRTVLNSSDDRYRGPFSSSADSRYAGELQLWNKNGEIISKAINCIAEDNNGIIWIGTDKGPVLYYRPNAILDEERPIATQINIPRNDGSGFGDYLLSSQNITSIAIDPANRKWLGTSASGVYLISEDGTMQIEHFTAENSPLPSNNITCINVEGQSGEVFIGTSLGLVSFRGSAIAGSTDSGSPIVFPNPVRADYSGPISIKGFSENSTVKITDVSGNIVFEMESLGGQAVWNGTNFNGDRVKTGVYFILITNSDGTISGRTKVMVFN